MRILSNLKLLFTSTKYTLGSHWGMGGLQIFIVGINKNYKYSEIEYTICYTKNDKFNYRVVSEQVLTIILEGIYHTAYGKLKYKKS